MKEDTPEVGDYVEVTYTTERGAEENTEGRVIDVETDCDRSKDNLEIRIDEGEASRHVRVTERTFEGETFTAVSRYSEFTGSHHLGENASIRELN